MQKTKIILLTTLLIPCLAQASYIETTMGTAVVNDATASYFNPAALMLLKNSQFIPLVSFSRFDTQFKGQTQAVSTGFTASGTSSTNTNIFSPSFYVGMPLSTRITIGFAAVTNYANRNPEENAILRYTQSSNTIQDYDFVPSVGFKLNQYLSFGAGVNFSRTNLSLHPITGFPGTNIPDGESNNQSSGKGIGGNVGLLLQPRQGTIIGFNYRTTTAYNESGTSKYSGIAQVVSNNYHFTLRTPPRSILSISQMLTQKFGIIGTVQRMQWNLIRNIHAYGIATQIGLTPAIVNATIPQYLHNTWLFTLGANYRFKPNWIARIAGTYSQSPDDGYYQISNGNSYILGGSIGYDINKTLTIDGSYAHAFIQNQSINISGNRFLINGSNRASRDVVALKLTVNV